MAGQHIFYCNNEFNMSETRNEDIRNSYIHYLIFTFSRYFTNQLTDQLLVGLTAESAAPALPYHKDTKISSGNSCDIKFTL